MRDNGQRREWWHVTRRYRDGARVVLEVPVRRSRRGAVPLLPANCELVGGAVVSGAKRARVLVRRWPDSVRPELARAGVDRLVETMYGGQRERIVVPPAVRGETAAVKNPSGRASATARRGGGGRGRMVRGGVGAGGRLPCRSKLVRIAISSSTLSWRRVGIQAAEGGFKCRAGSVS